MRSEHDVLMQDPKFRELFAMESAVTEAAGLITQTMAAQGVSKADLAKRLGKSRAWVTQMLSGENNVTVRTLAQVLHLLGQELQLTRRGSEWVASKEPLESGQRGVSMKMTGKILLRPCKDSGDVFKLADDSRGDEAPKDTECDGGDPTRPRYAA